MAPKKPQQKDKSDEILELLHFTIDETTNGFKAMEERFDAIDERFNAVDKRFDAMDDRFDKLEFLVTAHDRRITILEDRMRLIATKVGLDFRKSA